MNNGKFSKYKTTYPEKLIEHMRAGNSYESFCAIVHCSDYCLAYWKKKHKAFSDAHEYGKRYEQLFWENILKNGAQGIMPPIRKRETLFDKDGNLIQSKITEEPSRFNPTAVIFALKCKFPKTWRDKQEIEITRKDSIESLSDDEIKRRKELYANIIKSK
jgi:hypothetical protein